MAGVYLHIPYCIKKCAYCDFVSFAEPEAVGAYVDWLLREIALAAERLPVPEVVESVFLGGGTPSLLAGAQMAAVLDALRARYPVAADAEITVECNPGTVDEARLAAYRAAGVNRLSVGLQSADDALLAAVGRIHTYARFAETMAAAARVGFDNINVDVMHGLPGQTESAYLDTLACACSMEGVRHVSAYALILEEGTPLFTRVRAGSVALPDEDAVADMQDAGMAYLAAHAAQRVGGVWTRRENLATPEAYRRSIAQGRLPVAVTRAIGREEEMFETVMLALRTVAGLSLPGFLARFGVSLYEAYPAAVAELRRRGWTCESATAFALNARGLDLQNETLLAFLPE